MYVSLPYVLEAVVKDCQIREKSFDSWISAYMHFREHHVEEHLAGLGSWLSGQIIKKRNDILIYCTCLNSEIFHLKSGFLPLLLSQKAFKVKHHTVTDHFWECIR